MMFVFGVASGAVAVAIATLFTQHLAAGHRTRIVLFLFFKRRSSRRRFMSTVEFSSPVLGIVTSLSGSEPDGYRALVASSGTSGILVGKENQVVEIMSGSPAFSGLALSGQALFNSGTKLLNIWAGTRWNLEAPDRIRTSWFDDVGSAKIFAGTAGVALVLDTAYAPSLSEDWSDLQGLYVEGGMLAPTSNAEIRVPENTHADDVQWIDLSAGSVDLRLMAYSLPKWVGVITGDASHNAANAAINKPLIDHLMAKGGYWLKFSYEGLICTTGHLMNGAVPHKITGIGRNAAPGSTTVVDGLSFSGIACTNASVMGSDPAATLKYGFQPDSFVQDYSGNGSQTDFVIPWTYRHASDIQVAINGTIVTAFTFPDAQTVRFSTAPTSGASITLYKQSNPIIFDDISMGTSDPNSVVPLGLLAGPAANVNDFFYTVKNCCLTGRYGVHINWANHAVFEDNWIFGTEAIAITAPADSVNSVAQKIRLNNNIFSATQDSSGYVVFTQNLSSAVSALLQVNFTQNAFEFGHKLFKNTGAQFTFTNNHIERITNTTGGIIEETDDVTRSVWINTTYQGGNQASDVLNYLATGSIYIDPALQKLAGVVWVYGAGAPTFADRYNLLATQWFDTMTGLKYRKYAAIGTDGWAADQAEGRPYFIAKYTAGQATNVTGDGTAFTMKPNSAIYNNGNGYDASTGLFTARKDGPHQFAVGVAFNGLTSSHTVAVVRMFTSGGRSFDLQLLNPWAIQVGGGYSGLPASSITVWLLAGETVRVDITVQGGSKVVELFGVNANQYTTYFEGREL
jgi:hypothetical protein